MQKRMMEQVYIKLLSEDERVVLALNENRLDLLVEQELTDADISTMDAAIGDAQKGLEKLAQGMPDAFANAAGVKDYIQGLSDALSQSRKAVAEIELDDPDGISNLAKKYFGQKSDVSGILRAATAVQGKVAAMQDSLEGGIASVGKALEKVVPKEEMEKKFSEIAGTGEVPDEAKLKQGIAKALKDASGKKKGFLGKMMGFFSRGKGLEDKILGSVGELDIEGLGDALYDMSLKDLVDMAGSFKSADIPPPPEDVATKAVEASEEKKDDESSGEVKNPDKKEKRSGFNLKSWLASDRPDDLEALEQAGLDMDDPKAIEIDKAIEDGKVSPDDAVTALKDAAGEEGEGGGKKWADISTAVAGAVEDKASAESILQSLQGSDSFKDAVKDKVVFEEGRLVPLHHMTLGSLLFEQVSFEDLKVAGGEDKLGDDVDADKVFADLAGALNSEIGEEIITDIPEVEEGDTGGEGEAQSEEEMEETDAEAEAAAEAAADEAESANMSPGEGAKSIVGAWAEAGKTLAKNVSQKQRGILGDSLAGILDAAAESLAAEVEAAVDEWRSSQKVLQKPNVSDKQIDALKGSLRDFVAGMITSESARSQDIGTTKRQLMLKMGRFLIHEAGYSKSELRNMSQGDLFESFVVSYCNMHAYSLDRHGVINEGLIAPSSLVNETPAMSDDDLVMQRWIRAAGLDGAE
jgi:hypothetical protein